MPAMFQGHCPDCGHDWEAVTVSYLCGPIEYQAPETYRRYFCARCFAHLNVPRVVDRISWLNWIAGHAYQIAECPSLIIPHERIARALAESRSHYAPVIIDIGTIACPDCSEQMVVGDIDSNSLNCPRCANRSARSRGIRSMVTLRRDCDGPAQEDIGGVIDHLKKLSRPRMRPVDKTIHELSPSEGVDPLWDPELDH
jgi:hypothetical protein